MVGAKGAGTGFASSTLSSVIFDNACSSLMQKPKLRLRTLNKSPTFWHYRTDVALIGRNEHQETILSLLSILDFVRFCAL